MSTTSPRQAHYEELLGRRLRSVQSVSGGDIGESVQLECEDRTRLFAKHYPGGDPTMASAEAHGLAWLASAKALRVPSVLAASEDSAPHLVLEWIDERPRAHDFEPMLGRGLAALHRSGAPRFGLERNNFIGSLPQRNGPHETWAEFYSSERIAPQVEMAARAGLLPNDLMRRLERLCETMSEHVGPEIAPARLHGDLWAGNVIADERGHPCLVDPAVYGGHPEIDLGMMKLFGGFSARVFDAYREANPLPEDHEARTKLCQLYPLLVHVNLFGSSYVGSVAESVAQYV